MSRNTPIDDVAVELKRVVHKVAEGLVDNPGKVFTSSLLVGYRNIIITITPPKNEVGKVLGKQGLHLAALDLIAQAIATKHQSRVTIFIDDGGRYERDG